MKKIISVSRRTDIPAFYGEWFINRVKEGFAGHMSGRRKYIVSLKPEDVDLFFFWSKNYLPFMDKLKILRGKGYQSLFHYTITGLPQIFECDTIDKEEAINNLIDISKIYSKKHISWRYDPIIISDKTDYKFHTENFANIAAKLAGYVDKCYISFADIKYKKVIKSLANFKEKNNISISELEENKKKDLANDLANIAQKYNIIIYACCNDYLLNDSVKAGGCIDINLIREIIDPQANYKRHYTRTECRCAISTDIGAYDTCHHGCVYCYATRDKQRAENAFNNHDVNSAFLCVGKAESDSWITEIKGKELTEKQKK